MRPMSPGAQILGSPGLSLSKVELLLANVLVPECTGGATYDAIFCDVGVTEEELPMLLSLLRPNGRLVCLIEEVKARFASFAPTRRAPPRGVRRR